jgi:hypothetical protein
MLYVGVPQAARNARPSVSVVTAVTVSRLARHCLAITAQPSVAHASRITPVSKQDKKEARNRKQFSNVHLK